MEVITRDCSDHISLHFQCKYFCKPPLDLRALFSRWFKMSPETKESWLHNCSKYFANAFPDIHYHHYLCEVCAAICSVANVRTKKNQGRFFFVCSCEMNRYQLSEKIKKKKLAIWQRENKVHTITQIRFSTGTKKAFISSSDIEYSTESSLSLIPVKCEKKKSTLNCLTACHAVIIKSYIYFHIRNDSFSISLSSHFFVYFKFHECWIRKHEGWGDQKLVRKIVVWWF